MTPDQRALRDAMAGSPGLVAAAAAASAAAASGATVAARAAGQWSAREVVLHLVAVEEAVWQARLDALAEEAFPHWPWTEPGLWTGPGDDTLDGALAAFAARRAATVAGLDALDAGGWARRGRHDTFGILDVAALLRIALDHDAEHLRQIRGDRA